MSTGCLVDGETEFVILPAVGGKNNIFKKPRKLS